jgi:hypothetical protein
MIRPVFNRNNWHQSRIQSTIWQGLIEYGRGDWNKTRARIAKKPSSAEVALAKFDEDWGNYNAICAREGMKVNWVLSAPTGIG